MDSNTTIVCASFGTTREKEIANSIGQVEQALSRSSGCPMVRAFTSGRVRCILASRGKPVDGLDDVLETLAGSGSSSGDVVLQSLHMVEGVEYQLLRASAHRFAHRFRSVRIVPPLLARDALLGDVISALNKVISEVPDGRIVLMAGHGTRSTSQSVYAEVQRALDAPGRPVYVPLVESDMDSFQNTFDACRSLNGFTDVHLFPLMLVSGEHWDVDICGPGGWVPRLEAEGFKVYPHAGGLGRYPAVQDAYCQRLQSVLSRTRCAEGEIHGN